MSRSKWKLLYIDPPIKHEDSIILTRRTPLIYNIILKYKDNKHVYIHNGKLLRKKLIKKDMIGFKLGEFSFTRILPKHKK